MMSEIRDVMWFYNDLDRKGKMVFLHFILAGLLPIAIFTLEATLLNDHTIYVVNAWFLGVLTGMLVAGTLILTFMRLVAYLKSKRKNERESIG